MHLTPGARKSKQKKVLGSKSPLQTLESKPTKQKVTMQENPK